MDLKFYLNKIIKVDNIENYSLTAIIELKKAYTKFLETTEGADPDFPMMNFLGNGKRIKGTNIYDVFGDDEEAVESILGKSN